MNLKSLSVMSLCTVFSISLIGCGGGSDAPSVEDAPPTPEPASAEYESYNNSSQGGPATEPAPSGN